MKIEFKGDESCPAKDNCKTSGWCICSGEYGKMKDTPPERLQFLFVPLLVTETVNGRVQGRYVCETK